MKGFITNIELDTLQNDSFRKVLYTASYVQLVVMTIPPGEEIGEEVHGQDQFIRIEEGEGKSILDGEETEIGDGIAVLIPAGTKHNIVNTSESDSLRLYSLYSPPHHADGVEHKTKAEAESDEEEFIGDTTD